MALAAGGAALVMATAGRVPIAAQSLALGQRHRRTEALFVLTPPPGAWCLACHGTLWWTDVLNERALLRSKALAGTMTTAQGKPLVFAMFVNDVPLPPRVTPSREGQVLGKLSEIIYQYAE